MKKNKRREVMKGEENKFVDQAMLQFESRMIFATAEYLHNTTQRLEAESEQRKSLKQKRNETNE